MKKWLKIMLAILVVVIILILTYVLFMNNSPEIYYPIDNEENAINFAKSNNDFIQASNKFNKDFNTKLLYNAYFDDEKNTWIVSVWPKNTNDLWYEIRFDKQGNVIHTGYGKGS